MEHRTGSAYTEEESEEQVCMKNSVNGEHYKVHGNRESIAMENRKGGARGNRRCAWCVENRSTENEEQA